MRILNVLAVILISINITAQKTNSNCKSTINGIVINKTNNNAIPNTLLSLKQKGNIIKEAISDEFGKFSFQIDCNQDYQISAIYPNFTINTKLIFSSKVSKKYDLKLELFPISEFEIKNGKNHIIVDQITFLPDDYSISKDAEKPLDKISELLQKYKHLKIEIGFHTDSRGETNFLQKLTQKRADACANYLIKKGIDSSRIIAKGYGDTELLNNCKKGVKCSNAEHLINRRTEIIILNPSLAIQKEDLK